MAHTMPDNGSHYDLLSVMLAIVEVHILFMDAH